MRIGITGNYAAGKGTVCSFFEQLGAINLDTDLIARDVVKPGTPTLQKIVNQFGPNILNSDQTLNRSQLASIVFKDSQKVELLNSITHPAILEKTLNLSKNPQLIYVINVPLLFESGFNKFMNNTIVVATNENQIIERGMIRDQCTENEIKDRLKYQFSLNKKLKLADYSIDNSYSLKETERQVKKLWNTIIKNQNSK